MNKDVEIEINGLGFQRKNYPGAFTPTVEKIIYGIINDIKKKNRVYMKLMFYIFLVVFLK